MTINKFQSSRLTFQPRSLILESQKYIRTDVFSQTIDPIEFKFHLKTPYDKLIKMYAKYLGHKTKMTATPIYGKSPLKKSSSPDPEGW